MSINAHKEGPPRLVIGLGTRAIQISSRRRVAGRLRIPCPVVANIKQVMRVSLLRFRLTPPRIRMRTSVLAFA